MKKMNVIEMSTTEMEVTTGGCWGCAAVDIAAACIKGLIHARR